jgi:hypothetical protein
MVRSQMELMQRLRAEERIRQAREKIRLEFARTLQRGGDPAELAKALDDVEVPLPPSARLAMSS